MDRPPPDPSKLLDEWMEWERGEATPGRVMANLKTAGLRDLLEVLVEARPRRWPQRRPAPPAEAAPAGYGRGRRRPGRSTEAEAEAASAWTPTV